MDKITFNLDKDCANCKRGFKKYQKLQARNTDAYMGRNLKTGKSVGKLHLIPDQNASGVVTHWHIN